MSLNATHHPASLSRRLWSLPSTATQIHPDVSPMDLSGSPGPDRLDTGPPPEPAFSAKDLVCIQKELARCKYGWAWPWLSRTLKTTFVPSESGIAITDRKKSAKLRGDCKDLSIQLSQRLAAHFKDKYRFYIAAGNFKDSPWQIHFFILGWPTLRDEAFQEKMWHQWGKIPNGVLVIDPALRRMGTKQKDGQHPDWLNTYSVMNASGMKQGTELVAQKPMTLPFNDHGTTSLLPLGFLDKLEPELKHQGSFAMVGFKQVVDNPVPKVVLALGSESSGQAKINIIRDWRLILEDDSKLYKLLDRVERRLQRGYSKAMAVRHPEKKEPTDRAMAEKKFAGLAQDETDSSSAVLWLKRLFCSKRD